MRILALLAILILGGCAGFVETFYESAEIGVVKVSAATFDNAKIVELTPANLFESQGDAAMRLRLGALWRSPDPDAVALVVYYPATSDHDTSYLNFYSIDIKLQEKSAAFPAGRTRLESDSSHLHYSGFISTSSEALIPMPLELLREMVDSPVSTIRVHTSIGYMDANFSIEQSNGQLAAKLAMSEFLKTIDSLK